MDSIIEFKNVTISFNGKTILEDVNLDIHENKIMGLVGRSGSGKTTLFRLFLGVYLPTQGKIFYKGRKINNKIKEKVGFASQENSFYPRLTVEENISYFASMYGIDKRDVKLRMARLLELVDLQESSNVRADNLSGGMKRRLDLAIALVHDPDVLILDEPTTGLDIILNENIWNLILKIHKLGKTIVVSSHNLVEIEKYCQEVTFVSRGKIIDWKHLKQLRRNSSLDHVFRRLSDA
tara:strand:- start:882 stop:1589 length:708 start_codon:yes stop_codon:yes gene_type:complete